MSNEKRINYMEWKAGLDELASLPGEPVFDSNASWQKLELRLVRKTSSRKIFFYRAAAASVLLAFLIFGIKYYNRKDSAVRATIVLDNIPADKKETMPLIVVKKTEEFIIKNNNNKSTTSKKDLRIDAMVKKEPITKNDAAIEKLFIKEDSVAFISVAIGDVQQKPVVFPSLKKKIRVIHINELDKALDPVEAVAGSNERSTFKARFFNRQTFQEADAVSVQGGNILRIKLSPQN